MQSKESYAKLIASMLQGRNYIGPAWDALEEERKITIIANWQSALNSGGEYAVKSIIDDIQLDRKLGPAWILCGQKLQMIIIKAIELIASNSIAATNGGQSELHNPTLAPKLPRNK